MINLTVKLNKRNLTLVCCFLGILLLMALDLRLWDNESSQIKTETLDERIEYINSLGLSVNKTSETVSEIYVPESFNEAFVAFNNDLKEKGFGLDKLKGETIKRYLYTTDNNDRISLFVYNNILVGYDINKER